MRGILLVGLVGALSIGCAFAQAAHPGVPGAAAAKPKAAGKAPAKTLEGTIKGFECGDNCYLTIVVASGREETGLCEAKACTPWFENQEMPKSLLGKRVRVTLSVGVQRDASGNVMGKMTSFKTIEFVK